MSFKRSTYIGIALWHSVQLASVFYCLLASDWIEATNNVRRQGLFMECKAENVTCTPTQHCLDCNATSENQTCHSLTNETQGPDEEVAGGLLTASVIFRVIFLVMYIAVCFTDDDSALGMKADLRQYFTIFEEVSGLCDVSAAGIYLFFNSSMAGNICFKFGVGFWLNVLRPLLAFVVLRLICPWAKGLFTSASHRTPSRSSSRGNLVKRNERSRLESGTENIHPQDGAEANEASIETST